MEHGIDRFVNECKQRVLRFAARQTEQSVRLGYWMDWDNPDELRETRRSRGHATEPITYHPASGKPETGPAHQLVARLGQSRVGRQLLHVLHREQRNDLDVPQEVLRARENLPGPRRDALVRPRRQCVQPNGSRRRPQAHRRTDPSSCGFRSARRPSWSQERRTGLTSLARISPDLDHHAVDADQQRGGGGESGPGLRQNPHANATAPSITSPKTTSNSSGWKRSSKKASAGRNGNGPKARPS